MCQTQTGNTATTCPVIALDRINCATSCPENQQIFHDDSAGASGLITCKCVPGMFANSARTGCVIACPAG